MQYSHSLSCTGYHVRIKDGPPPALPRNQNSIFSPFFSLILISRRRLKLRNTRLAGRPCDAACSSSRDLQLVSAEKIKVAIIYRPDRNSISSRTLCRPRGGRRVHRRAPDGNPLCAPPRLTSGRTGGAFGLPNVRSGDHEEANNAWAGRYLKNKRLRHLKREETGRAAIAR